MTQVFAMGHRDLLLPTVTYWHLTVLESYHGQDELSIIQDKKSLILHGEV